MHSRAALLVTFVVALTIATGSAASAHANYSSSSPRPNERLARAPNRISVTFSEAPDPAKSGLDLISSDGRTIASGGSIAADPTTIALPLSTIDAGTYVVAWHTVSAADGDPARGYFAFAVGADLPASGTLHTDGEQTGVKVSLDVTPGRAGANGYRAIVTDTSGASLANVVRVRLRIESRERDLGVTFIELPAAAGAYAATGMELALAGRFGVTVEVRRRDILSDLMFPFELSVPLRTTTPPSATTVAPSAVLPSTTPAPRTPAVPLGYVVVAGLIVLTAGAALVLRRR